MKVLLAGWFSFEDMGATAGDVTVRDLAAHWLDQAGIAYDVAVAPPFDGTVHWRTVDPADYAAVVFTCGPFGNGPPLTEFLDRFRGRRLLGLNLSMLQPLEEWNPFACLIERDSSSATRPDLSFLGPDRVTPVVGLILRGDGSEYGARHRHGEVMRVVDELVRSRDAAFVPIDTCLTPNTTGLGTAAQIEALIARMDATVTTRLHGLVFSVKHGVPPVAIDPVAGGGKVSHQAQTLGWPALLSADTVDLARLSAALDYCLGADARDTARACARQAREQLSAVRGDFLAGLGARDLPAAAGMGRSDEE